MIMRPQFSFPLVTTLTILVLAGLFGSSIYLLINPSLEHQQEYSDLIADNNPAQKEASLTPYTAKQERHRLHKHLWLHSAAKGSLQLCVKGGKAALVLDRGSDSTQIIEHMSDVQCYMQEELYYLLPDGNEALKDPNGGLRLRNSTVRVPEEIACTPMQIIRFMEADKASYYYETDKLTADNVKISRFALPGHELAESLENATLLMTGIAQSMEFYLSESNPEFQASQLKATLYHPGSYTKHDK